MHQSELELLEELRASAREELRYLSNGGKEERERWVISEFLTLQKIEFSEDELHSPSQHSKIDVEFRNAKFQIKEILNPGTRRYKDAKARYDCLMAAKNLRDIQWPMLAYDIPPVTTIYNLISSEAFVLSISNKYIFQKANLDLIFYVTRTYASLIRKEEIDHEYFSSMGWRSISCLAGKQAILIFANKNAPAFLSHKFEEG